MALSALSGCQDTLFPKDTSESPYDRYTRLRGEPQVAETDRHGFRERNLRDRLRPLDAY